MTRNERQLKAVQEEMARHSEEAQAIWKKAEDEDRETSNEERGDVEKHLKAIETLKGQKSDLEDAIKVEADVKAVSGKMGPVRSAIEDDKPKDFPQPTRAKSIGEQFIENEAYKKLVNGGMQHQKWTTGAIDIDVKANLLEGANYDASSGSPGTGAPLVPIDQRPGVLPILYQRLTVADLMPNSPTASNHIRYVRESVATNAAATVAEAGAKPESALEFDTADTPVRKIATFLPVSDEMLEDAPALAGYINARLSLFVEQEEEDQLLNGNGSGTNLNGLIKQVPAANLDIASGAVSANNADHIYSAITHVRTTSFLEPDAIVMNPDDWEPLRLLKDDNKNYIAGPPFANNNQFGGEPMETLWGKRVVLTQAIQGQILVGAFRTAAQVFRRGGLSVEASNSHASFFTTNLVAIRAEERLALAVYRPAAFATVDIAS